MDIQRLEKEIMNQHAKLMNSISTRQTHPSYGYTKARLREEYNELIGMLKAWLYVTGKWDYPASISFDDNHWFLFNQQFAVDIKFARFAVEAA